MVYRIDERAVLGGEERPRIDGNRVAGFIALVQSFSIEVDHAASERAFSDILPLCRTHRLTSYDAAYLDLAIRSKLPLATLDEPLRKAAKKLGVKLLAR